MATIINPLPDTFVNGTVADATQVNANFNQVVANVNANAAENGANSSITSLSGLTTPLSVPQGGTGAVTLSGVLVGNGTGAVTGSNTPTNWTPADASGASLSLTVTNAIYMQFGKIVVIEADITYPATGSTATLAIGGVPAVPDASATGFTGSVQVVGGNTAVSVLVSGNIQLVSPITGNFYRNVDLSGFRLRMSFVYFTA